MGKDRRVKLANIAGVGAGGGPIGSIAGAAGGATAAYFDAEARKEVARQEVHKEAVRANQGIMHELDRPFLDYNAQVGTTKKPATLGIQLSILSAYMLGVIAEKAYNDAIDAKKADTKISEYANNALQIRAPLTALSAEYKLGPAPPKDEAEKDAALKKYQARIARILAGDVGALFG